MKSLKARRILGNTVIYIILSVMAVIWVLPILWLVLQSFSNDGGATQAELIPHSYTLHNYACLFYQWTGAVSSTGTATGLNGFYTTWFLNTLIVAVITCAISTLFVLGTAYALSRFRFKGREQFMKINLILGMFPGFLGMIILYWVMSEILHLEKTYWALVIIYSAGSGGGYYIAKGFFDTISKSIDEAAMIDGASKSQIFWQIILPLAKPIIIYTVLTSFMGPWGEYITASYIIGPENTSQWTIAMGLYQMLNGNDYAQTYYLQFCSGSVMISIPITALFLCMQKYYVSGVTGGAVKG